MIAAIRERAKLNTAILSLLKSQRRNVAISMVLTSQMPQKERQPEQLAPRQHPSKEEHTKCDKRHCENPVSKTIFPDQFHRPAGRCAAAIFSVRRLAQPDRRG